MRPTKQLTPKGEHYLKELFKLLNQTKGYIGLTFC